MPMPSNATFDWRPAVVGCASMTRSGETGRPRGRAGPICAKHYKPPSHNVYGMAQPVKFPVLHVALDILNLHRALQIAQEAAEGGADWIEAGTPLIKSEGMEAIRALRKSLPGRRIVAD